jgi:hypothetical protein
VAFYYSLPFLFCDKESGFFIDGTARTDCDDLNRLTVCLAINDPDFTDPEASIAVQFILELLTAGGFFPYCMQSGMYPFFQDRVERADEGGEFAVDADRRQSGHMRGPFILSVL